eukprot:1643752-Alexandrium_andersonii.AAC.1
MGRAAPGSAPGMTDDLDCTRTRLLATSPDNAARPPSLARTCANLAQAEREHPLTCVSSAAPA